MRATISVLDFSENPSAIMDRVRRGDSFLIEQDGEAIAALEPVGVRGAPSWQTLMKTLHDGPSGDPEIAAALEEIQRNQPDLPADVWYS